jgi:UDP-2,3-diacylglucosamine hydrolase
MIGLIFGDTAFPKQILKKVKQKKSKYFIIDLSKKNIFKKEKNSFNASIGQFGKIIDIIRKNKCSKVLFAGKVNKPNFSKIKLDFKGIYYIPRIVKSSKLGDAAVLKEIIKILKKEKINTISSLTFNPELGLKKGNFSKIKPNNHDQADIRKAIGALNKLSMYNYSQGIVVRNKKVIAIEGKKGTQNMLSRCKNTKFSNSGVLVKFPKRKQDKRIDLPTVGYRTFFQCHRSGLKGIVLKSKMNIFLEKDRCIKFANKCGMFITVK